MSGKSRDVGQDFEERIEPTFDAYSKANRAYLAFMPVPTKAVMVNGRMYRVGNGSAPFDVYGFVPRSFGGEPEYRPNNEYEADPPRRPVMNLAVMVGAELKATSKHETSLSIVKPKCDGSGLEFHQLDALALLARMGGLARIVWSNAGEVGVLTNEPILAAHAIYMASLASEGRGMGRGKLGTRSIRWESFIKVDFANVGGSIVLDWLLDDKEIRRAAA